MKKVQKIFLIILIILGTAGIFIKTIELLQMEIDFKYFPVEIYRRNIAVMIIAFILNVFCLVFHIMSYRLYSINRQNLGNDFSERSLDDERTIEKKFRIPRFLWAFNLIVISLCLLAGISISISMFNLPEELSDQYLTMIKMASLMTLFAIWLVYDHFTLRKIYKQIWL